MARPSAVARQMYIVQNENANLEFISADGSRPLSAQLFDRDL